MADLSIMCPRVFGHVDDFGVEQPTKYQNSVLLPLCQYWNGADALPVEKGTACVGAGRDGLCFYVCFIDSDIISHATANNQKLWTLGDVAEFFVKPGSNRSDYWEIHVTPNNFIMDIHIPNRDLFMRDKITWGEVILSHSDTRRRVQTLEDRWTVEVCIPWKAFGLRNPPDAGTAWSFAVCRYNCNGGLDNPENSSSAHFTELSFHRWEEFTELVF